MVSELKALVQSCGLTRYRIAKLSDGRISESELSRWVHGRLNLGPAKLDLVAEIVGAKVVAA